MKKFRIVCPQCKQKTKVVILSSTEMNNFPLFCPWCKKETIISVRHREKTE